MTTRTTHTHGKECFSRRVTEGGKIAVWLSCGKVAGDIEEIHTTGHTPSDSAKLEHLDDSDVATILAALRCFQERYEGAHAKVIREDWPDHFEGIRPLSTEDIGTLCERINFAKCLVLP